VWLAHDLELGEPVVVKVITDGASHEAVKRLRREISIGRELRHPNIVRLYELIETPEGPAITMEWCAGGNLARLIPQDGLPVANAIRLARDMLEALAALHARGIVHRDVKPSNVLLDADGSFLLGDLGLVWAGHSKDDTTRTRVGVGTPGYMSPEQLAGSEPSLSSDLFALGATLHHAIAGSSPFSGGPRAARGGGRLRHRAPSLRLIRPDCPRWLARFVRRLLEADPEDRWPDAKAALNAFVRRRLGFARRTWRRIVVAAAALVAVSGATAWLIRSTETRRAAAFTYHGSTAQAVDAEGRGVWSRDLGSPIRQVIEADLIGDGRGQIVVATADSTNSISRAGGITDARVVILDREGHVLDMLVPSDTVGSLSYKDLPPPHLLPQILTLELDGDPGTELIVNCRHRDLGSAYLFLYRPERRYWQMLFQHIGGWIFNLTPVPDETLPRLRFYAVNARIGELPVVGQLAIPEGEQTAINPGDAAAIPGAQTLQGAALEWYTPFPQMRPGALDGTPVFACDRQGISRFAVAGIGHSIDRWGNPMSSPNAGSDLADQRLGFLRTLQVWHPARMNTPKFLEKALPEVERQYAALLAEEPYREILDLFTAEALASMHEVDRAVDVLERRWRDGSGDMVGLRLAHVQAISGDLHGALVTLQEVVVRAKSSAGRFSAPQLSFRIAIELQDEPLLSAQLASAESYIGRPALQEAVMARARLWWDRPWAADADHDGLDLEPSAGGISLIIRWRLGLLGPDAVAEARENLALNPDAAAEGYLALGLCLAEAGDYSAAQEAIRKAETQALAHYFSDFRSRQTHSLVVACKAKVLAAARRHEAAVSLALAERAELRDGLLPAVLMDEVLGAEQTLDGDD